MTETVTQAYQSSSKRRLKWLWIFIVLSIVTFILSLSNGSVDLSLYDYLLMFSPHENNIAAQIVLDIRLPHALLAFSTGALLSIAGALMQVLLRNPLADPYILGISGGASVFALIALSLGFSELSVSGFAFIGAILATLLVFGLARGHGSWTPTRLLLTGVVLAAGWGAIISFILSLSSSNNIRGMLFWLMGDLSYSQHYWLGYIVLIFGLAYALVLAPTLNILAIGSQQAQSLGVNVASTRIKIYILGSLLTASAVVQAGSIGFVGLIIPHALRLLGIRDYRILLPCAAFLGGSLLIVADIFSRSLFDYVSLPVGVMTVAIGVPVFIYLLYRGEQRL